MYDWTGPDRLSETAFLFRDLNCFANMLKEHQIQQLVEITGLGDSEILELYQHFQLLINHDASEKLSRDTLKHAMDARNIESVSKQMVDLLFKEYCKQDLTFKDFVQLKAKKEVQHHPLQLLFETKPTWTKDDLVDFVRLTDENVSPDQIEWTFQQLDVNGTGHITYEQLSRLFLA